MISGMKFLPRFSASPAAEAAQKVKTVAADVEELLQAGKDNWVFLGSSVPVCKELSCHGSSCNLSWAIQPQLPVPKMIRAGQEQEPQLENLYSMRTCTAGVHVLPSSRASWASSGSRNASFFLNKEVMLQRVPKPH